MNPHNHEKEQILLAPQAVTHGATAAANFEVNGQGSYATIRVLLASEANTNATGPTISLLESDDTVVTNFATVVADRTAEDITNAKAVVYKVDLRGRKKVLRVTVTPPSGSTNNNITVSADGTISHCKDGPSSEAEMAGDTTSAVVVV